MREVVERMKAGAVMAERSPLKDAIDWEVLVGALYYRHSIHVSLPDFEKRRP